MIVLWGVFFKRFLDFILDLGSRPLEFPNAFSQTTGKLWQLLPAKNQEYYCKNKD